MNLLIKYCLRETNLDSLLFHFIFLLIPYIIILIGKSNILILYWPYLIGIAKTFTLISEHNFFKNLYPTKPKDVFGYISKYFINTVVIFGILYQCTQISNYTLEKIVLTGLILFICSFLLSHNLLEYIIDKGYQRIKNRNQYYGIYKFILGFYTTILVIILQSILIYIVNKLIR